MDYLLAPASHNPGWVVVVAGDEAFLKREVLSAVRDRLTAGDDLACTTMSGREAQWRDVSDALGSQSLFGGGSTVVLEDADTFVTRYRTQLEDHAARKQHAGALLLDVKTWPGNTRLAKTVAGVGLTVKCSVPERNPQAGQFQRSARKWIAQRAEKTHGRPISPAAVEVLFELLPPSLGIMDQEVAKLALLVQGDGAIEPDLVQANVGGWRTQRAWDMIDAAADGDARTALTQLDRLLRAGEQPIGLLAQISSSLRKFAAAACLIEQDELSGRRPSLRNALEQAGVMKFKLGDAERQLKQIGRKRARLLDQWLLESDLALKGHNSTPARGRFELERLLVRLSHQADDRRR